MQLLAETRNEMRCQFFAVAIQFGDDSIELFRAARLSAFKRRVAPKIRYFLLMLAQTRQFRQRRSRWRSTRRNIKGNTHNSAIVSGDCS